TSSTQIAKDVQLSNILNGLRGPTLKDTGFTGVIENMSNVVFGAGLNLVLGSNVSYVDAPLAQKLPSAPDLNDLGNAFYALGKNKFSVGGNIYNGVFESLLTSSRNSSTKASKFITDMIASSVLGGELSFGEPTIAPGVHLLSGLTGGDTYAFEGFWGIAAVVEPPSVNVGIDLNFGYDTLDMSGVSGDMTFDIYSVSTDNIKEWQAQLDKFGHPIPLSLGVNLVLARNNAGTKFIEEFGKMVGLNFDANGYGLNYVIATGIENIIGGGGDNTFVFHGDAVLPGYVACETDGSIKFDYADYTPAVVTSVNGVDFNGVVVASSAGLQYGIPGTENPLPFLGTFGGANVSWGRASGVSGSRLAGLDLWAPTDALGSFAPQNNAVDGLSGVVGSSRNDYINANDDDNVIELGQGGSDVVDGRDGDDTLLFEASSQWLSIDMSTGIAHSALSNGTVTFAGGVLVVDADRGVFTLSDGSETTGLLQYNATAEQIQFLLRQLSSIGDTVTVEQASANHFTVTFSAGNSTTLTVNADPGDGNGSGLVKFGVPSTSVNFSNIEAVGGSSGGSVIVGTSEDDKFVFSDEVGNTLIYGGEGNDVLDFAGVTGDVDVKSIDGGLQITYGGTTITAFGTFETEGIDAARSGAIKDFFAAKLLGGDLSLAAGGSGSSTTTITSAAAANVNAVFDEAVARWNAILPTVLDLSASKIVIASGNLTSDIADVSYDSNTKLYTITLDADAAGGGWYIDTLANGVFDDTEFSGTTNRPMGVDLLTVFMHEMGHIISLEHPAIPDATNLMNETLKTGVRLNPTVDLIRTGLTSDVALSAGLDEFGDWAQSLGSRIDTFLSAAGTIPFTDVSLTEVLGVNIADFGTLVNSKVDVIAVAMRDYFAGDTTPDTNGMLLALQGLNGIQVTAQPGIQEYNVTVDLATYSQSIVLDLSTLSLDLSAYGIDVELPFNFGLSTTQSQPLQLTAGVFLDFIFGIDNSGQFFTLDPKVRAGVSFGEVQQAVIGVNVTDRTFTVAGDITTPTGQVNSDNGHVVAGDRIALSGSTGNDNIYTVVSATYDIYSDTTVVVVQEEPADGTADGQFIKTMDFGINLGPLGLESTDAVLSLSVSAGIGLNQKLTLEDLQAGGDAYTMIANLSPFLGDDSHYTIVLPIGWSGVLKNIVDGTGYITATSALISPDTSLAGFLAAIPSTIQITGMSDLVKFSGLSLDTILAALESVADDLVGTDTQLLGQLVNGTLDTASGEYSGGSLKVYGEVWKAGTVISAGYTPVVTNGTQDSIVVEGDNGRALRLLKWQVSGTGTVTGTVYGIERPTGQNSSALTPYAVDHYRYLSTYSADDVALNLQTVDVKTGVQLWETSTPPASLTDSVGNLSLVRVRDGELYNKLPVIDKSLAECIVFNALRYSVTETFSVWQLYRLISLVMDVISDNRSRDIHQAAQTNCCFVLVCC
ncbi:MAG: hypothetical protein WCK86_20070, partial [Planctomycetia bacterium]